MRYSQHCLKLERWQGLPHIDSKVKQHEIVLSFKVSLFIQFVQSETKKVFFLGGGGGGKNKSFFFLQKWHVQV